MTYWVTQVDFPIWLENAYEYMLKGILSQRSLFAVLQVQAIWNRAMVQWCRYC